MIFKIPILIGLLYLFIQNNNALLCASIYGGLVFLLSALVSSSLGFNVFLGSGISFLVAMGYFSLLDYFDGEVWWWPSMILGMLLLLYI